MQRFLINTVLPKAPAGIVKINRKSSKFRFFWWI